MKDTEDLHSIAREHDDVVRIERLTHHMMRIRESVTKMESSMEKMAEAINKLAIIEERQNQDRAAMERAFSAIADLARKHDSAIERVIGLVERVEERVDALEQAESLNKQARYWIFGAIGIAAAGVLYATLRNVGL